jgi:uncharacterized membrane protein SirB2
VNAYLAVRDLHVTCVTLSVAGFAVRGLWRLSGRRLPRRGWLHWAPHVNDTFLLVAGIVLALMSKQYPGADAWLTAKVVGLVVYVGLGSVALRDRLAYRNRLAFWLAAMVTVAYVVSVALTKNPAGFLAALMESGGA